MAQARVHQRPSRCCGGTSGFSKTVAAHWPQAPTSRVIAVVAELCVGFCAVCCGRVFGPECVECDVCGVCGCCCAVLTPEKLNQGGRLGFCWHFGGVRCWVVFPLRVVSSFQQEWQLVLCESQFICCSSRSGVVVLHCVVGKPD